MFTNNPGHMTKMAKTLKKSSSPEPMNRFQGNLACNIREYDNVITNHDPVMTLTYFRERSTHGSPMHLNGENC